MTLSLASAIVLFLLSLFLSTAASIVLASSLERIGSHLRLAGGLLGMIMALTADTPEMSSAVTAIIGGHHDLGLTVILGSNVFNIAVILGVSGVLAGEIRVGRLILIVNASVALLVAVITMLIVLQVLSSLLGLALLLLVLIPYTVLNSVGPRTLLDLDVKDGIRRFVRVLAIEANRDARDESAVLAASSADWLIILPGIVSVLLGSAGMVSAAVALGKHWNIPHVVLGTFILATLTSIPNLLASVRLSLQGRGAAAVSESLNSNSFNVIVSIAVPAVILGLPSLAQKTLFVGWWFVSITLVMVLFALESGQLGRWKGIVFLVLYVVFIVWFVAG